MHSEWHSNPFATRHWRAGAFGFVWPEAHSESGVLSSIREHSICQIVGPHGTGKSTLLRTLRPKLEQQSPGLHWIQLSSSDTPATIGNRLGQAMRDRQLMVIDGAEQIATWQRWLLFLKSRQVGRRVLVTCHKPFRIPIVWRTATPYSTFHDFVAHLQRDVAVELRLESSVLRAVYERHTPNCREMLFELYDRFESRLRRTLGASA